MLVLTLRRDGQIPLDDRDVARQLIFVANVRLDDDIALGGFDLHIAIKLVSSTGQPVDRLAGGAVCSDQPGGDSGNNHLLAQTAALGEGALEGFDLGFAAGTGSGAVALMLAFGDGQSDIVFLRDIAANLFEYCAFVFSIHERSSLSNKSMY